MTTLKRNLNEIERNLEAQFNFKALTIFCKIFFNCPFQGKSQDARMNKELKRTSSLNYPNDFSCFFLCSKIFILQLLFVPSKKFHSKDIMEAEDSEKFSFLTFLGQLLQGCFSTTNFKIFEILFHHNLFNGGKI